MGWGTGNIGGSSAGLNFKIVGGTTEPSSPKENAIWVNTDQKITSYILSATEPEVPEEGTVWISTGMSSSIAFSVTKKNPVMVYPISAKQYVSGAWVDVETKSYQNGEWVDWIRYSYLFKEGEGEKATFTITKDNQATINVTKNAIEWGYQSGATANWVVSYCTKYDVTDVKTIFVEATVNTFTSTARQLAVILDNDNFNKSNQIPTHDAYNQFSADGVRKIYTLDVSSFTGMKYIGLMGAAIATIHNFYVA